MCPAHLRDGRDDQTISSQHKNECAIPDNLNLFHEIVLNVQPSRYPVKPLS